MIAVQRVVVVIPDWFGDPEGDSVLRQGPEGVPNLLYLAENAEVFGLRPLEPGHNSEAAYLGLDPTRLNLADGPLFVAALGIDPPARSAHFCLSLLSLDDTGKICSPGTSVSEAEQDILFSQIERLSSSTLKIVRGEGLDHGLVWEGGSIDLKTVPASAAIGQILVAALPEGDGESILRRLIDDSVNLLSEIEINRKRVDEERPPLNLLWPWGQGFRPEMPNLALQRGEPAFVLSGSLRMAGLTALVRYRHGNRAVMGQGLNIPGRLLAEQALAHPLTIVVIEKMIALRKSGKLEEMAWLTRELDEHFFGPLVLAAREKKMRLTILAPNQFYTSERWGGLGLVYEHGMLKSPSFLPFDERAYDEPSLRQEILWQKVEEVIQDQDI